MKAGERAEPGRATPPRSGPLQSPRKGCSLEVPRLPSVFSATVINTIKSCGIVRLGKEKGEFNFHCSSYLPFGVTEPGRSSKTIKFTLIYSHFHNFSQTPAQDVYVETRNWLTRFESISKHPSLRTYTLGLKLPDPFKVTNLAKAFLIPVPLLHLSVSPLPLPGLLSTALLLFFCSPFKMTSFLRQTRHFTEEF